MIAINKDSLTALSDSQLLKRLDDLVRKERQTTLEILRHIIEMDRRRLYFGRGYASLYEYCTRHLGYSESAAFRRIQSARCIRDFPEVQDMLLKNELNITTVSKLYGILSDENKEALLKDARGRSTRQVESIVAGYNPKRVIRDRVRPVFIKTINQETKSEGDSPESASEGEETQGCGLAKKDSQTTNWVKFTSGAGGKKLTTCRSERFSVGGTATQIGKKTIRKPRLPRNHSVIIDRRRDPKT